MKRNSVEEKPIECHNTSQRKFPMPGTDLGTTTAIPYEGAPDVDGGGSNSRFAVPSMTYDLEGTRGGRK